MKKENLILIGKLVNTHGIRGEVKIMSSSDFKEERFKKGNTLFIGDLEVTVKSYRPHKNFDLVVFEEFNNINQVEQYKGTEIYVSKDTLSELDEDEFYYHELEGLEVYLDDEFIGKVYEMRDTPGNDLLVIKKNGKNIYIPFVEDFIKEIDLEKGIIKIEVIEGLLWE